MSLKVRKTCDSDVETCTVGIAMKNYAYVGIYAILYTQGIRGRVRC